MFGRKKNGETKKNLGESIKKVRVIPDEFYGGKDPVIYLPQMTPKSSFAKEVKAQDIKKPAQVGTVGKFAGRKIMIMVASAVFLVGIIGGSVYYLRPVSVVPPVNTPPVLVEAPLPVVEAPEATPVVEVVETAPTSTQIVSPARPGLLEFPSVQIADSADMDSDALTDFEEESFGTDPGIWDTDNDGYYDGQELVNLYNPRGFAPVKLIDSGLVAEYVNPVQQYRVYYPINWQVGEVDNTATQVLFSTVSGDFIEISLFEKNSTETFADWFAREARGQQFTDVVPFANRFEEPGFKRKDGLVAYFTTSNRVYVFIYHLGASNVVSYRHVIQMMYNSFRPSKTLVEIPDQSILPGVVSSESVMTTSTVETSATSSTPEIMSSSTLPAPNNGERAVIQSPLSTGGVG